MDNELNQSMENKSWLKNPVFLTLGIFFFLAIVTIPILVFSLKKTNQKPQAPSIKKSADVLSKKFFCPSISEFCKEGKAVFKDGEFIGFGGKLASGSAIFAAFDGTISATTSALPDVRIIYIYNPNLKLQAIYQFRGSLIKTGRVFEGQQIIIAGGKTLNSKLGNNTLVFSIIEDFPAKPKQAVLTRENFK